MLIRAILKHYLQLDKLHLTSRLMTSIGPNDSNPFSLDINLLTDQRCYFKFSELLIKSTYPLLCET